MFRRAVTAGFAWLILQQLSCSAAAVSENVRLDVPPSPTKVADSNRGIGLVEREPQGDRIQMGEFWAVLIGIDEYDHWPKLSTAVKDAKAVEELLKSRYGFDAHHIRRITNKEATRQGILDAFEWLVNEAGENDNVLIYYAGHGELDKVSGYWVPVDARKEKKAAYISNSTVRDYIGGIKAKHVFLVADSCFSGSLFAGATRSKPPVITGRYFKEAYDRISRQGLTSGGTEPVSDHGYEGHSIFAYYFLKALRDNIEPYLTATSLFDRIAVPVANNSKQTPVSRPIRDVRDEGGEFIFALADTTAGFSEIQMGGGGDSPGVAGTPQQNGNDETSSENKDVVASSFGKLSPLRAIVLMSEKNLGVQRGDSIVGNALSEKLGERGVRIVSEAVLGRKQAQRLRQALGEGQGIKSVEGLSSVTDAVVWGSVETRSGHTGVEGLVSCLADASLQVISVKSGEMIVQKGLTSIRGFGVNEERACLAALQNMGTEVGPAIIEKLEVGRR